MNIVAGIASLTDWTAASPKISNAIGETIGLLNGQAFSPRIKP
jgi:hypothetical protein